MRLGERIRLQPQREGQPKTPTSTPTTPSARMPSTATATSPPQPPPEAPSTRLPGRVGDSSLIGCGCYADNLSAAVSLTGWGEPIMKLVLGKWAVDRVQRGSSPRTVCCLRCHRLPIQTTSRPRRHHPPRPRRPLRPRPQHPKNGLGHCQRTGPANWHLQRRTHLNPYS